MTDKMDQALVDIDMDVDYALEMVGNAINCSFATTEADQAEGLSNMGTTDLPHNSKSYGANDAASQRLLDSQSRYLLNSYAYMVSAQNKITNYLRSKNMAAPGLRLVDTHIRAPEVIEGSFVEIKDSEPKMHLDDCNYNMFATECNCEQLGLKHINGFGANRSIEQDDTIVETVQENY